MPAFILHIVDSATAGPCLSPDRLEQLERRFPRLEWPQKRQKSSKNGQKVCVRPEVDSRGRRRPMQPAETSMSGPSHALNSRDDGQFKARGSLGTTGPATCGTPPVPRRYTSVRSHTRCSNHPARSARSRGSACPTSCPIRYTAPRAKSALGSMRGRGHGVPLYAPQAVQFVPAVGPAARSGPELDAGWLTAPGIVREVSASEAGTPSTASNPACCHLFRFDTGPEAEILPPTQSISSVEDSESLSTRNATTFV
ncbi:hypothetical protein DFH09DRAFT_1092096 [Mycena vulgaris]|nr:hypothetical protein DFH09DRAFT_1092096 [Mycena vulgaris]